MEEIKKLIRNCEDVLTLQSVITIFMENMEIGMNDANMFQAMKETYGELAVCHYIEEMAQLYFRYKKIDGNIWDAAKLAYTSEIIASYPDVTFGDWMVLYGRMSLNTTGNNEIVKACKMFLDNKFVPYYDIID